MKMKKELNQSSERWRQGLSALRVLMAVGVLCTTYSLWSLANSLELRSYSYISPPAKAVLQKLGITEAELENFTNKEVKSRAIVPIDGNRLFEGSEDALRIDIRKKSSKLLVALSVRQGVSIHYMLERWSKSRLLPIEVNMSSKDVRRALYDSITELLDDLKSNYNSPAYKRGEMIPEDYRAERDE